MNCLQINGQNFFFIDKPLAIGYQRENLGWICESNFIPDFSPKGILVDVEACFSKLKQQQYLCAYVADYSTRTLYYDKDEALEHVFGILALKGQENYFINFNRRA